MSSWKVMNEVWKEPSIHQCWFFYSSLGCSFIERVPFLFLYSTAISCSHVLIRVHKRIFNFWRHLMVFYGICTSSNICSYPTCTPVPYKIRPISAGPELKLKTFLLPVKIFSSPLGKHDVYLSLGRGWAMIQETQYIQKIPHTSPKNWTPPSGTLCKENKAGKSIIEIRR